MFGMVGHRAAHAHIRALNGEGTHFFGLGRIKIMNLGCLEALETMLMNVIQLILQADKDTGWCSSQGCLVQA